MAGFPSLRGRLERRLKTALAGSDLDLLVRNRDRRRLRWLAQQSTDPVLSFRALRNLAEIIDPQSEQIFLHRIQCPAGELATTEVRTAAEGLGRLASRGAGTALIRLLEPNRPAAVNLAAARALAALGSPGDWRAVRRWVLRSATENPPFPDTRDLIGARDADLGSSDPAIWVLLTLYPEKGLPWWSEHATAWLDGEEAAPRIDSERGDQRMAAQELRNSLRGEDLSDTGFRDAVLLLGNLSRDRDHSFLGQLGASQRDSGRQLAIQQAASLCADPRAVDLAAAQLGNLGSDDAVLLADSLRCAGRLASRELVGPIFSLWQGDLPQDARSNLIWALGECGGGDAVSALLDLVLSRDEDLSDMDFAWIARSLARCGNLGRKAVRGSVTISRAGGGERQRVVRLAGLMGLS
jgi:HEAT repeat protein